MKPPRDSTRLNTPWGGWNRILVIFISLVVLYKQSWLYKNEKNVLENKSIIGIVPDKNSRFIMEILMTTDTTQYKHFMILVWVYTHAV